MHKLKFMKKLKIGKVYTDKQIGKVVYMGRIGFELNVPGIKGSNIFVDLSTGMQIWLTKKDITTLQP